ncbi:MAG TPA: cyclopropane fatty acyl phospholipid synthase [Gammaproteobacteria bacterium]|nr:cyclopropane fatty acyl phospholipid synthase [Gammaproteobacteria bacterium]
MNLHVGHDHGSRQHLNHSSYRIEVEELLSLADVEIDGPRPWDIQVHNPDFYQRVLAHGTLGAGESYMEGWWDCADLDGMIYRVLKAQLDDHPTWELRLAALKARVFNLQSASRAFDVGRHHYDLDNAMYAAMLGRRLVYSCGYWAQAQNLDAAQEAKLELVFRKLGLKPGMRVLDIGCGWGETLKLAAERYGVTGVGITISEEQCRYARELCRGLPLEFRLMDYRDLDEPFDRILSIGMFEHVGQKNYRAYMETARRCLKDDGLFLLHCIGSNVSVHNTDPWIAKYIFPNGMLPSIKQIGEALEGLFVMEDWHNFSAYYDRTLLAWRANFEAHWEDLRRRFDDTFHRMWLFYLSSSAASFRARRNQLWQLVLSPEGVPGGYVAPR